MAEALNALLFYVTGARSIWTVDLAHLLRRFGLGVEFLTVTLGANPAYARERFYRVHLHEDCVRVTRLFEVPAQTL